MSKELEIKNKLQGIGSLTTWENFCKNNNTLSFEFEDGEITFTKNNSLIAKLEEVYKTILRVHLETQESSFERKELGQSLYLISELKEKLKGEKE